MKTEMALDSFVGFSPELYAFFEELDENQSRDWFQANKPRYEESVLNPFRNLIGALNQELHRRRIPLEGDPKRAIFRINRDVRFTPDKRPYKTNASAVLLRPTKGKSPGMLYIHLAPEESFLAVGFYAIEKPHLDSFRTAIAEDQRGWLRVERAMEKAGYPLVRENPLKRLPRGFEPEEVEAVAESLKLRSFVVKHDLSREDVETEALVGKIGSFAKLTLPLLEFGWNALNRPGSVK